MITDNTLLYGKRILIVDDEPDILETLEDLLSECEVAKASNFLEAKEEGKSLGWRWMERFSDYYDRKFGLDWKDRDKDFWESLKFYVRA